MDKTTIKGYSNAILSAASFGLIPLFTIPVLNEGMGSSSVLMYRFAFGCLIMLGVLMFNKTRMYIGFGDFLRILFLSSLYAVSAIALLEGYKYMPGGIATTLLFSYPVWTALLSIAFLHEHLSRRTTVAIILAVGGVALLSGLGGGGEIKSFLGPVFEMLAGLLYAVYMVTFPVIKVRKMPSLKLTFYIFFFTMILMLFYTSFTTGHIQPISSPQAFFNLVML
ncbi:MAG: DMT family transporter, partial [Prevotella pleuritidis]|nr:DMT family transporter [Hoylesella pleuritidis]